MTNVIGGVAGSGESPISAIDAVKERVAQIRLPEGYICEQYSTAAPEPNDR